MSALIFSLAVGFFIPVLFIGAGLTLWLTYMRLIELLRTRHPATWQALGSPTRGWLSPASSVDAKRQTNRYIVWGKYRELGDPQVNRLAGRYRAVLATLVLVAVVALVGVLLWLPLHRRP